MLQSGLSGASARWVLMVLGRRARDERVASRSTRRGRQLWRRNSSGIASLADVGTRPWALRRGRQSGHCTEYETGCISGMLNVAP